MTFRRGLTMILAACMLLMAGCSGASKDVDINPADAAKSIYEAVTFKDTLAQAPETMAQNYYLIDDKIASYSVYTSASGGTAEEIAVLKVADKKDVEHAKTLVQGRLDILKMGFENYRPDEMVKLGQPVIETRGDVVYFITADDPAQAKSAIEALYK